MTGGNTDLTAREVAHCLAQRIETLAPELLPGGHPEGHEWRAGSVQGEAGHSLGVHLTGPKAGVWADFATGEKGDALDLVRASLGLDFRGALAWSRRWLGIEPGAAELPRRPAPVSPEVRRDPDRWRYPWRNARPITGTLAATYLAGRGLVPDDPEGRVLRFAAHRCRKNPGDELELRPALLALLRDFCSGEPCGIINIFLRGDGRDRLRDRKAKTYTGRSGGAVFMLSGFCEPCGGLVLAEGVETGLALLRDGLRPVWAAGGAGNLRELPIVSGIECLTIAADRDDSGQRAAEELARRWTAAGREVRMVPPPAGDWADPR